MEINHLNTDIMRNAESSQVVKTEFSRLIPQKPAANLERLTFIQREVKLLASNGHRETGNENSGSGSGSKLFWFRL